MFLLFIFGMIKRQNKQLTVDVYATMKERVDWTFFFLLFPHQRCVCRFEAEENTTYI
jgi:hypothetical protein